MYQSSKELRTASVEQLQTFARPRVATLRQMHAIEELARRALADAGLLASILPLIAEHLGREWVTGGLPAAYLGAAVLFAAGGDARQALLATVARCPPLDRDDLLRWLFASEQTTTPPPTQAPLLERELLLEDAIDESRLTALIHSLGEADAPVQTLALDGRPALLVMASLTLAGWERLDVAAEQLARQLATTIYLWPPEALGGLHPSLLLAISVDGQRSLVTAETTDTGVRIKAFSP